MEHGELCVKNQVRTLGYLNKEESGNLFDEEGFLRTGDICYFDDKGDVVYVERIKELMK